MPITDLGWNTQGDLFAWVDGYDWANGGEPRASVVPPASKVWVMATPDALFTEKAEKKR
jgi:hypothetical protein